MSPTTAPPEIRQALIETAARVLAKEGPTALSTRRLASELGTSTMAVYTHFGGMRQLRRAVREEGFERLMGYLQAVPVTADPAADLAALGWAYCFNAIANPHLYRAIFLDAPTGAHDTVGEATFAQLTAAVTRCIDAKRFKPADPRALATQVWAAAHGMISAVLAHILTIEEITDYLSQTARHLFVGFGDDPRAARRSIARAQRRMQTSAVRRA
jgi:AcrR family transcriptional regulator